MESAVEDGVGMFTTYSDEEGELVVKHYCAARYRTYFHAERGD